jgi:type VI secretion system Hcp family effector
MATDAKHKDWIEIFSVSHGTSRNINPGSNPATQNSKSQVLIGALQVQKQADASSPLLVAANCEGKVFVGDVLIDLVRQGKDGKEVFYQWKLTDSFIKSYDVSAHEVDGQMMTNETITFCFSKVNWKYIQKDAKGSAAAPVEAGWSLVEAKRTA